LATPIEAGVQHNDTGCQPNRKAAITATQIVQPNAGVVDQWIQLKND